MRQLDLFASFYETPPEETNPGANPVFSEKNREKVALSEDTSPSYSKNALRSERFGTDRNGDLINAQVGTVDIASASASPLPVPPPSPILPSLFDNSFVSNGLGTNDGQLTSGENECVPETLIVADLQASPERNAAVALEVSTVEKEVEINVSKPVLEAIRGANKKVPVTRQKKQPVPELERTGSVIFDDGKISVKIKSKNPFPPPIIKVKKERVKKVPQKRGRKSFKEIDAEVDLIEIPEDEILFQKQYYPISEVANWFRVNTSLLRYWENEFDVLKPRKNRKGDRLFRPEDVKNLQLIYQLLRQRKYTIEGAKEYIKTNKKKADLQLLLTNTLQKFKGFLLDLKSNL